MSITCQRIPHDWKHAKVIPLYKEGARDENDNYRPISILPVVSKILERAVQQQLVDYLESHGLFSRYQSGFRHKYSTQSAITFLCDSIRRNMDAGQLTGAIFIDFGKAFDTIGHKVLLDKLQLFGIYDSEHRWMTDYLTDRTQSVFVGGVLSCPQQVVSGVPQGSILGPVLFSLYVTDLPNCLRAANVLMYADDTVIYYAASDANQLERVLSVELKFLHDWSTKNELFIHPKKTEYVIFGTAMKRNQINSGNLSGVYLGEQVLNCRPFYKYLGVYLDQSLSFKEHVARLVNKVSRQLGLLSRVRNSLTVHAAERIFTAMILPKLDYCDFCLEQLGTFEISCIRAFTNENC